MPDGYTSIVADFRLRPLPWQNLSMSRCLDNRNFRKLTPLHRHV